MRLRLEDNGVMPHERKPRFNKGIRRIGRRRLLPPKGDGRQRAIYNPETGLAVVLNDDMPLSGLFKGLKKKIKAKKQFKQKKQAIKQEQKLKRFENKQTAKTQRQSSRQDRKQARIVGKAEVQQAKRQRKIDKATQREREFQLDTMEPRYQEGSDQLPEEMYEETAGGEYQAQEAEAQVMPDDYGDYDEGGGAYDYYDEYEEMYEEMQDGQPMNGWLDTVFDVGKKLVNKAAGSKAGQAVKQSVINKADYDRVKNEAALLRKKAEELASNNITYGAVGLVAGTALGFGLGKITSKKR